MSTSCMHNAICFFVTVAATGAFPHTEQDYIDKGRDMVGTVMATDCDNEADLWAAQESDDPIHHWDYTSKEGFFGFFVTNGWTRADCETAFNRYLTWIGTNEVSASDMREKRFARGAIAQCECMNYTNALAAIRAYALSPIAEGHPDAMDIAIRLGGVDDESSSFFRDIVTNKIQYSYSDISWIIPTYCGKVLAVDTNNAAAVNIRNRDAHLFYANRLEWKDGTYLDDLFVATFPGYEHSSNRLAYANHVLSWTTNNDWRAMHEHFVTITNNLISSGQPLVNLSLDE